MHDDKQDQRRVLRLALPASLVLHVAIVALLIFGLPQSLLQPQEEQAVAVELVPPPKPPEKKVEPPAEKPPPEKPKPEKPPESKVEPPKPSPEQPARQQAIPRLNPVFRFGEKDAGLRKSPDGNSAEESSTEAANRENPEKPEREAQKPVDPPAVMTTEGESSASLPQTAKQTPTPRPAEPAIAKPQDAPKLKEAKKLFSRSATGDPLATTAMLGVPRDVRGGTLCVTELREQLLNASPPYYPDLLPSFRLTEGTTLDVPGAAFRVGGQWRALSYRCEVDAGVTKVVSFAFRIGGLIPRSEWQKLGLPAN